MWRDPARIEGQGLTAAFLGDQGRALDRQGRSVSREVDHQPPLAGGVGAQGLEARVAQHDAVADHDHPLGQGLDVMHVVGGQDDRDALLAVQRADELPHRQLGRGVQSDGRLVQEQQAGTVQHRRGDLAAHPLAERELTHRRAQQMLDPQKADHPVAAAAIGGLGHAVDVAQQVEAFGHRKVPPELGALAEHHPDPRHMRDPVAPGHKAADIADAGIGRQDAGKDLDGRRLAGAVRPDEAQQFAGLQRETDALQRLDGAVSAMEQSLDRTQGSGLALGDPIGLAQVFDPDLGHVGAPLARCGRFSGARTL